jgi:plastocyanin
VNAARSLFCSLAIAGVTIASSSCTSLQRNYSSLPTIAPTVTPSGATPQPSLAPSPGASIGPAACQTESPNATVIAMSLSISPATIAPYGQLFGYAPVDSTGAFNNVAAVVTVAAGSTVQFANGDAPAPQTIYHSAVGFSGTAFPAVPYAFPSASATQTGSAVSTTSLWSTSQLPGTESCFSQAFVVPAGTYYFGDITYYNSLGMRGVLIGM